MPGIKRKWRPMLWQVLGGALLGTLGLSFLGLVTLRLIGPMTPHLAEELWHAPGHRSLLADAPWPLAEDALLVDDTVTVAVQLNGKLRGTISLAKDAPKEAAEAAALALPELVRGLDGKTPKRVIVVPNRIVNVVV